MIPPGLSTEEAARRLARFGPNEIQRAKGRSPWQQLASQFKSLTILLLLAAGALSLALGEIPDAAAILTIVALNALVGFFQEYRAEKALLALRSLAAPRARVQRDGNLQTVPARDIVPGDVLFLEAGDLVAADARLLEANFLETQEAALTGESLPVAKSVEPVSEAAPLAERRNLIFLGTIAVAGTGWAEVVATGMKTELGRIAGLLSEAREEETPLQKQVASVGRTLLYLCLAIVAVVAGIGFFRGLPLQEVLLSSVSLAVASVPEGLPAVVTIALAIGVQRMAGRSVLVRRLPAVETLGCATVICTDKTGTLTTGVMAVREVWAKEPEKLLYAAAACSNAALGAPGQAATGDPTEIALLAAAAEREILRPEIEVKNPRRREIPFDSLRKRMSVLRSDGVLYVKGALESLLPLCAAGTLGASEEAGHMAARGLRVLAVAVGEGEEEKNLHLLGVVGIADPPRAEATRAVAAAREAGIRTIMITGDHPVTARAIAKEMGILGPGDSPEEIVHARVAPEEKLRIVRRWKERGDVVAMTGDGVNDAPALREAHIGIAMGKDGTEVAREASDMVLLDDNFASIVAAIREGRGIYENIRKTIVYLLAGNAAEILLVLGASLVGLPIPLAPLQLLWINLVTDGLPALALVADPADPDVLKRPPRRQDEPMLGRPQWRFILGSAALEALVAILAFAWYLEETGLGQARSLVFSVLVFSEVLRSLAARSERKIFWEVGALSNFRLLAVIALSLFLQIAIHHFDLTVHLFGLHGIPLMDHLIAFGLGLIPVSAIEIRKLLGRWRPHGKLRKAVT